MSFCSRGILRTLALTRAYSHQSYTTERSLESFAKFTNRPESPSVAAKFGTLLCTEVDERGEIIYSKIVSSRTTLLERFKLQSRDLRKLDESPLSQNPAILVRPRSGCLILRMPYIRAIIGTDCVVLSEPKMYIPEFSGELREQLIGELQGALHRNYIENNAAPPIQFDENASEKPQMLDRMPYEFEALEVMLEFAVFLLGKRFESVRENLELVLKRCNEELSPDNLRDMLTCGTDLSSLNAEVSLVRQAIADILNSDQDLANMYLTEAEHGKPRPIDQHDEAEILMETYLRSVDEVASKLYQLINFKHLTEGIMNIQLQHQRNFLSQMELTVAIIMAGMTLATVGAALFGMNLKNHYELDSEAFAVVSAMLCLAGLFLSALLAAKFKRHKKLFHVLRVSRTS